jgi:PKD repeat protein
MSYRPRAWHPLSLVVLLAVLLVAAASPWQGSIQPHLLSNELRGAVGLRASFTWNVPARIHDDNHNGLIDHYFLSGHPSRGGSACCSVAVERIIPKEREKEAWQVNFDASGSSSAYAITKYAWTVDQYPQLFQEATTASASIRFPRQGFYVVSLTVSDAAGQVSIDTQRIWVKDYLIVALGDSYGAGEGAPDVNAQNGKDATWQDPICHRSAQAPAARAALWLENASAQSSVTFIHLACSGAKVDEGLLKSFKGEEAQVTQLEQLLGVGGNFTDVGGRRIDTLFLSVGGNDVGFADIVGTCMATLIPPCYSDILPGPSLVSGVNAKLKALGGKYDRLEARFEHLETLHFDAGSPDTILGPDRVLLSLYPFGVGRDARRHGYPWCGASYDGEGLGPNFTSDESRWLAEYLRPRLHAVETQSAIREQWGTIPDPGFDTHGYCADKPWINSVNASLRNQHDLSGIAHPNAAGYAAWTNPQFINTFHVTPVINVDAATTDVTVNSPPSVPNTMTVPYQVEALDRLDGMLPVACEPMPGPHFGYGKTPVTCDASSWDGVKTVREFPVEVREQVPPQIVAAKLAPSSSNTSTITVEADGVRDASKIVSVTAEAFRVIQPPPNAFLAPPPPIDAPEGQPARAPHPHLQVSEPVPLNLAFGSLQDGNWLVTGPFRLQGRDLPPGTWTLAVVARDMFGNVSRLDAGTFTKTS